MNRISFDFTGTTVAITGAAGGLGKGIADAFSAAGANIVIGDLKVDAGNQTVQEINARGKGKAVFVKTDVSRQEDADAFFKAAIDNFGGLDVLINGAANGGGFFGDPITNFTDDVFDVNYKVNLLGTFHCVKACYDHFVGKKEGRIINISSVAGHSTNPLSAPYGATKAGVIQMTRSLAKELGPSNVKVNCLCPGYVYTNIYADNIWQIRDRFPHMKDMGGEEIMNTFVKANVALGRAQTLEDMANACMYFASNAGDNITGEILDVAGGFKL